MKQSGFVLLLGLLSTGSSPIQAQECPGPTIRVSDTPEGEQGNHNSGNGDPSSEGRYVVFVSVASNMLPGDANEDRDLFWRDLKTGAFELINITLDGGFPDRFSGEPHLPCLLSLSTLVAFRSSADDLVKGDTNERSDVFVRDIDEGVTRRVSVSSTGEQGNGSSGSISISGDGSCVSFASWASNLIDDDLNGTRDAFVHDLSTGETTLISVSSSGEQGNNISWSPRLSFDGRYVGFASIATNFAHGDTNNTADIFVHDRWTGQTVRISLNAEGEQGNGSSERPQISSDGMFVTFESVASNLVPDDTNFVEDVFVVEWQAKPPVVERVSVSSKGEQGNDVSIRPDISGDGRMVKFRSLATNLVPAGDCASEGIYVHDRWTGITQMVSTSPTGECPNGGLASGAISCDGNYVAFTSDSTNIVPDETQEWQDVFLRALDVPLLHPGDVDCDGDVDPFDLALLLGNWGPCPGPCTPGDPPTCLADFDHDCDVNAFDLAFLLGNWGP